MKGKNPELVVFTGPMFSSKTTRLLLAADKAQRRGQNVLPYKAAIDGRYNKSKITSHMGWSLSAKPVWSGSEIWHHVNQNHSIQNNDPLGVTIVVDEAFMIDEVTETILKLYRRGYTVFVSSIQLSSDGKSFDEMEKLLPYATKIEVCSAACSVCGADAFYSSRTSTVDDLIHVGGSQSYEPRCWQHFDKIK
jgi:thymidine kinase